MSLSESVERIEVSSSDDSKHHLFDGNPDTYWQSDNRSFPHYIKLTLKPDRVISTLTMSVSTGKIHHNGCWLGTQLDLDPIK